MKKPRQLRGFFSVHNVYGICSGRDDWIPIRIDCFFESLCSSHPLPVAEEANQENPRYAQAETDTDQQKAEAATLPPETEIPLVGKENASQAGEGSQAPDDKSTECAYLQPEETFFPKRRCGFVPHPGGVCGRSLPGGVVPLFSGK